MNYHKDNTNILNTKYINDKNLITNNINTIIKNNKNSDSIINENNNSKALVICTFSKYFDGYAIFTSIEDVIFKLPIPLVGLKLKPGQKYEFNFKRKKDINEKYSKINSIISKYIIK